MRTVTYASAIREALAEAMARDDAVFMIGEDIGESGGVFGVTKGLWAQFGAERVIDTPISEEAVVGVSVGASLLGARPVVEIMFSDFVTLAMDMVVNQAAKTHYMSGGRLSSPITLRLVTGHVGSAGAQHSQSLEAWFTHVPGLKCVAPSSPADAKALLDAAIQDPDPVCFFEHKMLYNQKGEIPDPVEPVPLGRARVVRAGHDVTIVAYLKTLHDAVEAADILAARGVSAEVLDPRTLVPFDRDALRESLERTGRLVIAHEAPTRGGFGAEIAAIATEECWSLLRAPVARVCGANTPIPYAPELEGFVVPNASRIAEAAERLLASKAAVV